MEIIDIRFSMNCGPLTADMDFVTATYDAGQQVKRFKKLKARVEEEKGRSGSGLGEKRTAGTPRRVPANGTMAKDLRRRATNS
jgi:hypothetical protein